MDTDSHSKISEDGRLSLDALVNKISQDYDKREATQHAEQHDDQGLENKDMPNYALTKTEALVNQIAEEYEKRAANKYEESEELPEEVPVNSVVPPPPLSQALSPSVHSSNSMLSVDAMVTMVRQIVEESDKRKQCDQQQPLSAAPSTTWCQSQVRSYYNTVDEKEMNLEQHIQMPILTITPSDELEFWMTDDKKDSIDIISLTNTTNSHVAYKIKITSLDKYRVLPSTGIVLPNGHTEINVYLHAAGQMKGVSRDQFLILFMEVGQNIKNAQVFDLFKVTSHEHYSNHMLRCRLREDKTPKQAKPLPHPVKTHVLTEPVIKRNKQVESMTQTMQYLVPPGPPAKSWTILHVFAILVIQIVVLFGFVFYFSNYFIEIQEPPLMEVIPTPKDTILLTIGRIQVIQTHEGVKLSSPKPIVLHPMNAWVPDYL